MGVNAYRILTLVCLFEERIWFNWSALKGDSPVYFHPGDYCTVFCGGALVDGLLVCLTASLVELELGLDGRRRRLDICSSCWRWMELILLCHVRTTYFIERSMVVQSC